MRRFVHRILITGISILIISSLLIRHLWWQNIDSNEVPKRTTCRERVTLYLNQFKPGGGHCLTCTDEDENVEKSEEDICSRYEREGSIARHALMNVMGSLPGVTDWITLVTQMTPERLDKLEAVATRWQGSISLALYITEANVWNFFMNEVCGSSVLNKRTNIFYHIVFPKGFFYPVNFLRNVALRGVMTELVFLSDVDFLPSSSMDLALSERLKQRNLQSKQIEYEEDYEPYLVLRTASTPLYDERFVGRLRNKLSHVLEVFYSGMNFVVLPDVFAIHLSHSDRKESNLKSKKHLQCAMTAYSQFKEGLIRKYGERQYKTKTFIPFRSDKKKSVKKA